MYKTFTDIRSENYRNDTRTANGIYKAAPGFPPPDAMARGALAGLDYMTFSGSYPCSGSVVPVPLLVLATGVLVACGCGVHAAEFSKSAEATFGRRAVARIAGIGDSPAGKEIMYEDRSVISIPGQARSRGHGTGTKHAKDGDTILVIWPRDDRNIIGSAGKYKCMAATGKTSSDCNKDNPDDSPDGSVSTIHQTI